MEAEAGRQAHCKEVAITSSGKRQYTGNGAECVKGEKRRSRGSSTSIATTL